MFTFAIEYAYISVLGKEEEHSNSEKTGSELNAYLRVRFVLLEYLLMPGGAGGGNPNIFTDFHPFQFPRVEATDSTQANGNSGLVSLWPKL